MMETEIPDITEDPYVEVINARSASDSIGWLVTFGLVFGVLILVGWGLIKSKEEPVSAGKAPDFSITSFSGQPLTLSELRGQVVVINFWASWCVPCRTEAPYLEEVYQEYSASGVIFIGVDYLDTESEALIFLEEFGVTYFNGPDLGTRISNSYNIGGIPETFFVGKNGDLAYVKIGPLQRPEVELQLDKLLEETYTP